MTFLEIAQGCGTDKVKYAHVYEPLFSGRRKTLESLLEIGVMYGQSMNLWAAYFPAAKIYGIDQTLAPVRFRQFGDRVRLMEGRQEDREFLDYAIARFGPWDVVVDDAGHRIDQQWVSFDRLRSSAGLYIVEDVAPADLPKWLVKYPGPQVFERTHGGGEHLLVYGAQAPAAVAA